MGAILVGNPAATVMTSSPSQSFKSPSLGEVREPIARRLAEDPELTVMDLTSGMSEVLR